MATDAEIEELSTWVLDAAEGEAGEVPEWTPRVVLEREIEMVEGGDADAVEDVRMLVEQNMTGDPDDFSPTDILRALDGALDTQPPRPRADQRLREALRIKDEDEISEMGAEALHYHEQWVEEQVYKGHRLAACKLLMLREKYPVSRPRSRPQPNPNPNPNPNPDRAVVSAHELVRQLKF